MKIFAGDGAWGSKNNFVDENNVFIGYDDHDDCCSDGGWFISDKPDEWLKESFKEVSMDLPGFVFDTKYFRGNSFFEENYSEGDAVQFRITNGKDEKFITLYNYHNGYYGKGFEFKIGEEVIKEGCL